MIKYTKFTFKQADVENFWIHFPHFEECLYSAQGYANSVDEMQIVLDPTKVYQVSVDQSTTNSGIFIKDYKNTEAYMIELSRDKQQDATDYIWQFEVLMHGLFEECTVSHLIYERPIKSESFRSSQVLFQLEGAIRGLSKRYKEFRAAKLDCIENSSWRAVIIDKGVEREYDRKESSRVCVQRMWLWAQDYGYSLGKDNDVYEAMGIMFGWFANSYDHLGRPYMRGDRSTRVIGGLILPGFSAATVVEKLKSEGVEDVELRVENPKYSIYQNLVSGVEPYKTFCVELTSKYAMLCMCIECNIQWVDPEVMTVILSDASCVTQALRDISGGSFHFVI